jgi:hypothetical protein
LTGAAARFQTEFRDVTGKPLGLDLTKAIRKVKASVALNVSVFTTLMFVMQRGFTWWQGLCFAYCVCLSVVTTGTWGTLGRALELFAERVMTELQLVRDKVNVRNPTGPLAAFIASCFLLARDGV